MGQIVLKPNRAYPALPTVGETLESHGLVLGAIVESIQTHERRSANVLDSFVRVSELVDLGLLDIEGAGLDSTVISDAPSEESTSHHHDGAYLRLDGTNDPVTGHVVFAAGLDSGADITMTAGAINWYDVGDAAVEFLNLAGGVGEIAVGHYSNQINSIQTVTDSATYQTLHTVFPAGTLTVDEDYLIVARSFVAADSGASHAEAADNDIRFRYGAGNIIASIKTSERDDGFVTGGGPSRGPEFSVAQVVTGEASGALLLEGKSAAAPENLIQTEFSEVWALNLTDLGTDNYIAETSRGGLDIVGQTEDSFDNLGAVYTIGDGVSDYVLFVNMTCVMGDDSAGNVPDYELWIQINGGPWTDANLWRIGGPSRQHDTESYAHTGILVLPAAASTDLQFKAAWHSNGGFGPTHGTMAPTVSIIALRLNDFVDYTIASSADLADPGSADEVEVLTASFTSSTTSGDWGFLGGLSSYFPGSGYDAQSEMRVDINAGGDVDCAGSQAVTSDADQAEWMLHAIIPIGTETNINDGDSVDFGLFVVPPPNTGADELDAGGMVAFSYFKTVTVDTFTVGDPAFPTLIDGLSTTIDSTLNVTGAVTLDTTLDVVGAASASDFTGDFVQFDVAYVDGQAEGRLQWDGDHGTLEVGMPGGNVNLAIGQQQLIRCRNTTGVPIPIGSAVYVTGASGHKPLIALADASTDETADVLGFTAEEFLNNSNGYVITTGLLHDVDTLGLTAGDVIFLSETAGEFTITRPTPPAIGTHIGHVIEVHETEGVILVTIFEHTTLAHEVSDVIITSVASGELLAHDGSTWLNQTFAELGLNVSNWDTAYGWGDHAGLYEPLDATLVRDDDVGYNKTEWDTAYGWGDHASGGYLTSETSHADVLVDGDIGVNVQAYDADTAKTDVDETVTGAWSFRNAAGIVIFDAGGADSGSLSHDGTDFLFGFTSTTDVLFTGATDYKFDDSIFITESSGANSNTAGEGQFWVQDNNINSPRFSTDSGVAYPLNVALSETDYEYSSTVTASDPGAGKVRFDSVTIGSITEMYIDDIPDLAGHSYGWVLDNLAAGDLIWIKGEYSAADYIIATVTSTPTDNTGWWTVPLTLVATGAIFTDTDHLRIAVQWLSVIPAETSHADVLVDGDIGVNVQAYDATYLVDADIGVSVQAAGAYLTTVQAGDVDAEASTDGYVLTSDGAGNAAWEAVAGGGGGGIAWEQVTGADTIASGEGFSVRNVSTAFTITLEATIVANDEYIIHNASDSTGTVDIEPNTGHTIKGALGDVVGGTDTLVVAAGETVHLVARTSAILEIV